MKEEREEKNRPEPGKSPRHDSTVPLVSLVVPVWNEKETLPTLHDRSRKALEGMGCSWEILLVDDGSTDGSDPLLRSFHAADPRVKIIFLSRNFGQHAALSAGLENARGEVVVIMDGDLQLSPEDIPGLVNKVREGYDLVGGWRIHRMDSSLRRKLPSLLFNQVLSLSTGVRLKDYNCGFKAMDRRVAERVGQRGDDRLYLAPLLVDVADRVTEIPVSHHPRAAGSSKYTLARSMGLILRFLKLRARGAIRSASLSDGPAGRILGTARRTILPAETRAEEVPLFVIREMLSG